MVLSTPLSQHQRFTLEEVLGSRMISDPLTLYQCAPTGDGVAALVLCAEDIAQKYSSKPKVKMAGAALCSQVYVPDDPTSIHAFTIKASREAYEMAGCGPKDLDVIELHDCFSIAEICHYENLGLCAKGEGGRLVDEGSTEIGGRIGQYQWRVVVQGRPDRSDRSGASCGNCVAAEG
jgi:acetyl-CoA acetyltransferase